MVFKYTFQKFIDIQSSATSMNIITVRSGGQDVFNRCKHLFGAYKYFKLGRIKIKLVPAATLPVDPLGLSYGDTDPQTVDPRDQLNPGLVRITNGENILNNISGQTFTDRSMDIYTNMLVDPRWSKFMLQAGFTKSAIPLFYDVGYNYQTQYPQAHLPIPVISPDDTPAPGDVAVPRILNENKASIQSFAVASDGVSISPRVTNSVDLDAGLLELGHHKRMGWMPTDGLEYFYDSREGKAVKIDDIPVNVRIPKTDVFKIILPKAYKTVYYYRLFVSETVYFSGVKNVGIGTYGDDGSLSEVRALDNFNFVQAPYPTKPQQYESSSGYTDYPYRV